MGRAFDGILGVESQTASWTAAKEVAKEVQGRLRGKQWCQRGKGGRPGGISR